MSSSVSGKKKDPKAEQSPQIQSHRDFLTEQNIQILTHPPYSPRLGSMWFLAPPHQRKRRVEIFPHSLQELGKALNSELNASSPSDSQNAFWILAQTTGTVCAKRRRVHWRNVNVVGKSDHCFLFYWTADITKMNSPRKMCLLRWAQRASQYLFTEEGH